MSIRNLLRYIFAACAITPTAVAALIGSFPGLRKLIEESDAIVILRIDNSSDSESPNATLYTTHDCYIYQSLKGDLHSGQRVRLRLMDTRVSLVTPYAFHSTHLMFLTKKRSLDEPTDYRTIEVEGANIRVSPIGHEKMPEGKTLVEKIRNLITNSMEHSQKEEREERRFLNKVLSK